MLSKQAAALAEMVTSACVWLEVRSAPPLSPSLLQATGGRLLSVFRNFASGRQYPWARRRDRVEGWQGPRLRSPL